MIVYNPLDGDAFTSSIPSKPKHCFLMTRLGKPVPEDVISIRKAITRICGTKGIKVIDATERVTGRDILLKIWKLIASTPLSVGLCHEKIPETTQANIYYELGIAQAMGKETLIVKSPKARIPSDFVRTEYVEYNCKFDDNFGAFLDDLSEQADHYELVADQLDRNPILAINYLQRAFLITGDKKLREKAKDILREAGVEKRAKNSIEMLAAEF